MSNNNSSRKNKIKQETGKVIQISESTSGQRNKKNSDLYQKK